LFLFSSLYSRYYNNLMLIKAYIDIPHSILDFFSLSEKSSHFMLVRVVLSLALCVGTFFA
jgi:hypothetical protein